MGKQIVRILAVLMAVYPIAALAQAPKDGVYITDDDIKAVLKHSADIHRTIPDNTIRVIDMGQYQLGVAVVQRGAMKSPANASAPTPARNAAPAAAAPAEGATAACGEKRADASGPNGIFHDDTAESYVVISGAGTLITGGTIVNGKRSGANDEVTTILNGPSCAGTMVGYTSRQIKVGDVIIIPEHVPHGFSAIPDHITYLSIRPDLKKVLQHGYVNPALKQ
jgi:mannose-6-phosphate isomerase-like protein (cupin superfamily)